METNIVAYDPSWFAARQGAFTGSEAWKLMTNPRSKSEPISVTAETYILEKVWETLSGKVKQGFDNFATEWGIENEPRAVSFYEKLTGASCQRVNLCLNEELPYFTGTPDRAVGDEGLIEVKCPFNGAIHLRHCMINTPEYFKQNHTEYYWQIQSYLYLTDRKWCDFVSFDPRINSDFGLYIYRLERNDEEIGKLIERIKSARELYDGYYKTFAGLNRD